MSSQAHAALFINMDFSPAAKKVISCNIGHHLL